MNQISWFSHLIWLQFLGMTLHALWKCHPRTQLKQNLQASDTILTENNFSDALS